MCECRPRSCSPKRPPSTRELHQFPRILHRKHSQQDLVDQREKWRCLRRYRGELAERIAVSAKPGILPKLPESVRKVLAEMGEEVGGSPLEVDTPPAPESFMCSSVGTPAERGLQVICKKTHSDIKPAATIRVARQHGVDPRYGFRPSDSLTLPLPVRWETSVFALTDSVSCMSPIGRGRPSVACGNTPTTSRA